MNNNIEIRAQTFSGEWPYDQFKEYAIALSKGPRFLLPLSDYPSRIKLSQDWHNYFDQMRFDSQDGVERWAIIGASTLSHSLYLPKSIKIGETDYVPSELIDSEKRKASNMGFEFSGDVHTHPRLIYPDTVAKKLRRILRQFEGAFSAADLYWSVSPYLDQRMMMLVEGQENLIAFQSRETEKIKIAQFFSQEAFSLYWYKKYGLRCFQNRQGRIYAQRNPNPTIRFGVLNTIDYLDLNKGIAQRHNLALYRGFSGQPLERVI